MARPNVPKLTSAAGHGYRREIWTRMDGRSGHGWTGDRDTDGRAIWTRMDGRSGQVVKSLFGSLCMWRRVEIRILFLISATTGPIIIHVRRLLGSCYVDGFLTS